MLNFYDYVSNSKYFKTFKVGDLLVVEYKCTLGGNRVAFWTHSNYFAYILSGVTKYSDGASEHLVRQGDALFVRRGTYIAQQQDAADYCALIIFASDDCIEKAASKYPETRSTVKPSAALTSGVFPIALDEPLTAYFHSVLSYFRRDIAPSDELLKVKIEELLLNILSSGCNASLAHCLRRIREGGKISIRDVMETSFMHPMTLEEYARLCGRSLSAFKEDFYEIYKTSPGRWLIRARVQYAKILIETTDDPVSEVAFKAGFKNTAHFVKVFKDAYGMPPLRYRHSEEVA